MGIIRANSWNWRPSALSMIHIDVIQPGIELPKLEKYNFFYFLWRYCDIVLVGLLISDTIILNQQLFTKLKKYIIYD